MATQAVVTPRARTITGLQRLRGLHNAEPHTARLKNVLGDATRPTATQRREQERQRLVVSMLPLVKRIAFQMHAHLPAHIEVDELVGAGMLGLVDAMGKFDASKRVKLGSYASHRIRGGILDGLRILDPASRDMRQKNKKVEKVYRELEAKLGRPASDEEMSAALGVSLEAWHRILQEVHGVGFDGRPRVAERSRETSLLRQAAQHTDSGEDPFELCYRREQREILNRALTCLPERQRLIMTLYYWHQWPMKQIAVRLNVDESRISQLHSVALARLKRRVEALLCPPRPALPAMPSA